MNNYIECLELMQDLPSKKEKTYDEALNIIIKIKKQMILF